MVADCARDLALVEKAGAFVGDRLERVGEVRDDYGIAAVQQGAVVVMQGTMTVGAAAGGAGRRPARRSDAARRGACSGPGGNPTGRRLAFHGCCHQELPEERGQCPLLPFGEPPHELARHVQPGRDGVVHQLLSRGREEDLHASPIVRVGRACHQAL